jgi:transcriptional regulator with XRE-family HTH domain
VGAAVNSSHPPIGTLLREWRAARRMSQLDLALEAGMSARHLSCVETGKSQASRETVGRLANALGMPLREHNLLMLAAGFAPQFSETPLYTSALERMNEAIELILRHQEPYPAFVINRHWEVLLANQAGTRMISFLMGGRPLRHKNMLHNVFDPEDFRPVIVNWTEIAGWFIRQLHEEIAASPSDQGSRQLLKEILAYPGVPGHWRFRDVDSEISPVLNLVYCSSAGQLRFFETITTFAGPRDVTLDELRIECFFPADERTTGFCARLAQGEL